MDVQELINNVKLIDYMKSLDIDCESLNKYYLSILDKECCNRLIFTLEEEYIGIGNYNIEPIFKSEIVGIEELSNIQRRESLYYILDNFPFYKGEDNKWYAIIDNNEILKISILEGYKNYEEQMEYHLGEDWLYTDIKFD